MISTVLGKDGVKGKRLFVMAGMMLCLSAGAAWAQVTASITGTVRDASGAVVPQAAVTVKNIETGTTRSAEADASGNYNLQSLSVGQYEVSVEKSGFTQEVRRGITLVVGQQAVVNLTLRVGNVEQQVTVVSEAPLVNTTLASTSGLVGEKEVKDLPLNGRSFDQLLTLNVGTSNYSSNTINHGFSVVGRRPEDNRFLMNGVEYVGASGGPNVTAPTGASGQALGVDAIREFNVVQHTYGAEYGKRAGGQVSIVTTSGTNQLHGSVFEFLRNSKLDGRNFFDQGSIPPFKRNNFGGSLGGPIKRDKLFLFGAYEGLRQRLGQSDDNIVPDANARLGLLPCNAITPAPNPCPASGLASPPNLKPLILPFANYYWPVANGPQLSGGLAHSFANPVQKVRDDYNLVRFDYNASEKDSASANYMIQDGENDTPSANPNFTAITTTRSQVLSIQETHIFSPALLNVVTLGFTRAWNYAGTPASPGIEIPANLLFVTGTPAGRIAIAGGNSGNGAISSGGGAGFSLALRNFFTYADDLHYIRGKHSLSAGVWVQRVQVNTNGTSTYVSGVVSYPTLQALLTDSPSTFQVEPNTTVLGFRSTLAAWYIQDEVKVKPNLTVRFGLRDEMTNGWNESKGRCSNYVFVQGVPQNDPVVGDSCLTENRAKVLPQPRVGVAWDPTGTGTWAVQAGFGIHNNLQDNLAQKVIANAPFNERTTFGSTPLLSVIPLPGGTQPPPTCNATRTTNCSTFAPGGVEPNFHTPTISEWSLTVERELMKDLMLQVGYVGSQSYHLQVASDTNSIVPKVCSDPTGCVSGGTLATPANPAPGRVPQGTTYIPPGNRPDPYAASASAWLYNGVSSYHGLNVSVVKRVSHGLAFRVNYTFAKALDFDSANDSATGTNEAGQVMSPYLLKLNKGIAAFSLKHQFNTNVSYELPFGHGKPWGSGSSDLVDKVIGGWQWNAILTAQSGFTLTPTVGSNRSGSGNTLNPDVPNWNPAFSGPVIVGTPNKWFDPTAFLLPIAGSFGNVARGGLDGPRLTTLDTSLFKKVNLSERWKLQFRAEVFNLLNHSNFASPNRTVFSGTAYSGSAGVITSTSTNSRQVQFALKLSF